METVAFPPSRVKSEKLTNIVDVLEYCVDHKLPAEIVGRWVWVSFDTKPAQSVRAGMKAVGFRWSKRPGKWAHNCGHPTTRSNGDPFWKYGVVPADRQLLVELRRNRGEVV